MMKASQNAGGITQFVDPNFIKRYEAQLDAKIASLESSIEEAESDNATFKENIRTKHAKVKEMKKQIIERENSLGERRKNLDSIRCINNELAEHTAMLKADADRYEQETAVIAARHTEVLNNAQIKWETYKKNYERLPHVMVRIKEDIKLKQTQIDLGMKRYRLEELKKQIKQRIAMDEMRRNRTIVECAVLWKAGKIGDAKLRAILDTQKQLRETLALQEITIETLKKQKEQSAQQCPNSTPATKTKVERVTNFRVLNMPRLEIPRGITPITELSSIPILGTCHDNGDNVSISSTLFSELLEPSNVREAERFVSVPGPSPDKVENFRAPSAGRLPQNYRIGEKSDSPAKLVTGHQKMVEGDKKRKPQKSTAEQHVIFEEKELDGKEACDYPLSGELMQEPPAPFEKELVRRVNEGDTAPDTRNLPRITGIDTVKITMPPRTPEMQYMDPSSYPYSTYSADNNSNTGQPQSAFSEAASSRTGLGDADCGSMFLESEASLQSEDMLKKLHVTFSPVRPRNYNDFEQQLSPMEKNIPRDRISQANIGKPQTAGNPGVFGDMSRFGRPAVVNPDKKEPIFLNMFR